MILYFLQADHDRSFFSCDTCYMYLVPISGECWCVKKKSGKEIKNTRDPNGKQVKCKGKKE